MPRSTGCPSRCAAPGPHPSLKARYILQRATTPVGGGRASSYHASRGQRHFRNMQWRLRMKRIVSTFVGVLALSAALGAQGRPGGAPPAAPPPLEPGASQADVDKALLAAPAPLKAQATVIKFKPDYTYDTLR